MAPIAGIVLLNTTSIPISGPIRPINRLPTFALPRLPGYERIRGSVRDEADHALPLSNAVARIATRADGSESEIEKDGLEKKDEEEDGMARAINGIPTFALPRLPLFVTETENDVITASSSDAKANKPTTDGEVNPAFTYQIISTHQAADNVVSSSSSSPSSTTLDRRQTQDPPAALPAMGAPVSESESTQHSQPNVPSTESLVGVTNQQPHPDAIKGIPHFLIEMQDGKVVSVNGVKTERVPILPGGWRLVVVDVL